jgi:hypothetical protein
MIPGSGGGASVSASPALFVALEYIPNAITGDENITMSIKAARLVREWLADYDAKA